MDKPERPNKRLPRAEDISRDDSPFIPRIYSLIPIFRLHPTDSYDRYRCLLLNRVVFGGEDSRGWRVKGPKEEGTDG